MNVEIIEGLIKELVNQIDYDIYKECYVYDDEDGLGEELIEFAINYLQNEGISIE